MLKIDLHVHTCYSYDGRTTLKEVIAYSKKRGLDGIAVTDHDTITGALKLIKAKDLIVIPGVEVSTLSGHMLALNITSPIPSNISPSGTVEMIREEGGIAVAPHPTTIYKPNLRFQKVDAIEVINSAAFPFIITTYLNRRLAARYKLPETAGSDAHFPWEIGLAYTLIDAEPNVDEIVHAIEDGKIIPFGEALPLMMRFRRIFS